MPGWGSWDWVGADLQTELARYFHTLSYQAGKLPEADVVFCIKHAPAPEWLARAAKSAAVIYCPIDFYGSAAAIDQDAPLLRQCARILVHCERLRRYFESYAPVEYMDHHVKFVAPNRQSFRPEGFFLWIGVRSNLPPLIAWLNAHPLPGEVRILTNLEDPSTIPSPGELGFCATVPIRIQHWTPELHLQLTTEARAALDIKDKDFRSRHKPPAKAIDFLASGVPLAMNPDSSPVEHLARMGFDMASPFDLDRWLSQDYWQETRRFGQALGDLLSCERIGRRWKRIIEEVLTGRQSRD
jgi:hypothetical protein